MSAYAGALGGAPIYTHPYVPTVFKNFLGDFYIIGTVSRIIYGVPAPVLYHSVAWSP